MKNLTKLLVLSLFSMNLFAKDCNMFITIGAHPFLQKISKSTVKEKMNGECVFNRELVTFDTEWLSKNPKNKRCDLLEFKYAGEKISSKRPQFYASIVATFLTSGIYAFTVGIKDGPLNDQKEAEAFLANYGEERCNYNDIMDLTTDNGDLIVNGSAIEK